MISMRKNYMPTVHIDSDWISADIFCHLCTVLTVWWGSVKLGKDDDDF